MIQSSIDLFGPVDAIHDVSICRQLLEYAKHRDLGEYLLSMHECREDSEMSYYDSPCSIPFENLRHQDMIIVIIISVRY